MVCPVRPSLDVLVIFSQSLPELSGAAADEMFDGLQSLQDAIRRRSLEPLVKVVHQMATVIRALVAKLDQNLPTFIYDGLQSEAYKLSTHLEDVPRRRLLTARGRFLQNGIEVGHVRLLGQFVRDVRQGGVYFCCVKI